MKTLTRHDVMEMSPGDLIIELNKRGVKMEELKGMVHGKAVCPNCDHEGPIAKDFGVRIMRGAIWPQSWCRDCRAGKNEKKVARKETRKERKSVTLHRHVKPGRRQNSSGGAQARSLGNF